MITWQGNLLDKKPQQSVLIELEYPLLGLDEMVLSEQLPGPIRVVSSCGVARKTVRACFSAPNPPPLALR